MSTFVIYTNGILLKFYLDFLLSSFNFMLLKPYAVYVCWNTDIHCMDYILFSHSLSTFVAFISCNYKHNVFFLLVNLWEEFQDFQGCPSENYACLNLLAAYEDFSLALFVC